jgi:quercetin dioxygenase-like cupin family protein
MKMTRLFSGKDGQSHFEDIDLTMNKTEVGRLSVPFSVENLSFGVIEGIDELSWHRMDSPQYIVILEGGMELEVGDGTKRIFKAGDILLAEDMTGQGHITRAINKQKWHFLIAPAK